MESTSIIKNNDFKGINYIKLLDNLKNKTYCRIGASQLSGVGVISIKPIDSNINPFQTVYKLDTTSIDLSEKDLESLDPNVKGLVKDFFMKTPEGNYPVYLNGLNAMDIAYYLNHSDNPNVSMVSEPDLGNLNNIYKDDKNIKVLNNDNIEYYTFKTIKPIKTGEELTIDYYQHAKSLKEIMEIRKQFKLPFPSYALKPKLP